MFASRLPSATIAVVLLGLGSGALAQDRGDVFRGRAFAENTCATCHAVAPGEKYSPIVGVAGLEEIANTPGMTALALSVWFKSPHPNMPNFMLDPNDLDNVIAYIMSLKTKR